MYTYKQEMRRKPTWVIAGLLPWFPKRVVRYAIYQDERRLCTAKAEWSERTVAGFVACLNGVPAVEEYLLALDAQRVG